MDPGAWRAHCTDALAHESLLTARIDAAALYDIALLPLLFCMQVPGVHVRRDLSDLTFTIVRQLPPADIDPPGCATLQQMHSRNALSATLDITQVAAAKLGM